MAYNLQKHFPYRSPRVRYVAWNFYVTSGICNDQRMNTMHETLFFATGGGNQYGFNGMERDDEWSGLGDSYDFGARIYDGRVGRWLAVDMLEYKFTFSSTYVSFLNNTIFYTDPDGETVDISKLFETEEGRTVLKKMSLDLTEITGATVTSVKKLGC